MPVKDLRAIEVGDRLEVEFTLPAQTTEGLEWTRISGVELRIGPGANPFDESAWTTVSKAIDIPAAEPGLIQQAIPVAEWAGKEVVIGVRARNAKGRLSSWSNLVAMAVVEPLMPPNSVRAESVAGGVRLFWQSPAKRVRILRKGAVDTKPIPLAETESSSFLDESAGFDQSLEYTVIALNGPARSQSSEPAAITRADTFPPVIPKGLRAILGLSSIELAWDPNSDADLRGYVLYRSVDGGEFVKVADLVELPSFSDRKIEPAKRYAYAVSAIDAKGNESERGPAVSITSPR